MPNRVRPIFDTSMKLLGKKWKDDAREIVGDNLGHFLAQRRSKLQADAQAAYEKFHPGSQVPHGSLVLDFHERPWAIEGRMGTSKVGGT